MSDRGYSRFCNLIIVSLIVARVKFEPESSSSHESSSSQVKFSFFFSIFVFNCCVKIMYQR